MADSFYGWKWSKIKRRWAPHTDTLCEMCVHILFDLLSRTKTSTIHGRHIDTHTRNSGLNTAAADAAAEYYLYTFMLKMQWFMPLLYASLLLGSFFHLPLLKAVEIFQKREICTRLNKTTLKMMVMMMPTNLSHRPTHSHKQTCMATHVQKVSPVIGCTSLASSITSIATFSLKIPN